MYVKSLIKVKLGKQNERGKKDKIVKMSMRYEMKRKKNQKVNE